MKKYIIASSIALLAFVSVVGAQEYAYSRDLTVGASGVEVTAMQKWLMTNGYDIPAISSGAATYGYFGEQTRLAVSAYQKSVGLPSLGYFGRLTRMQINKGGNGVSSLKITSPNVGETWVKGTTQNITWTAPAYFRATYADIKLVEYRAPVICPNEGYCVPPTRLLEYPIAKNISINQNSLSWIVSNYIPEMMIMIYPPRYPTVPDGLYTVQICEVGTSNCDSSDTYITLTSSIAPRPDNRPPVINGVDAPTTLSVNQTGTWTMSASDPENGSLSYSVDWGDVRTFSPMMDCPPGYTCDPVVGLTMAPVQQGSTFTHSYTAAGTYTIRIAVRDGAGLVAQTSVTVQVTGNSGTSFLRVSSPNGGEVWPANSLHQIVWSVSDEDYHKMYDAGNKLDLYLDRPNFYCITTPCPSMFVLDKDILVNTQYYWIVATDINNVAIPAGDYKVRICRAGSTTDCDSSDQTFAITR